VSLHERIVNGLRVKIETRNNQPPVTERRWDWSATTSDYEPGHPVGHGATEREAVNDLVLQLQERG
jgi:hypothetical protein